MAYSLLLLYPKNFFLEKLFGSPFFTRRFLQEVTLVTSLLLRRLRVEVLPYLRAANSSRRPATRKTSPFRAYIFIKNLRAGSFFKNFCFSKLFESHFEARQVCLAFLFYKCAMAYSLLLLYPKNFFLEKLFGSLFYF